MDWAQFWTLVRNQGGEWLPWYTSLSELDWDRFSREIIQRLPSGWAILLWQTSHSQHAREFGAQVRIAFFPSVEMAVLAGLKFLCPTASLAPPHTGTWERKVVYADWAYVWDSKYPSAGWREICRSGGPQVPEVVPGVIVVPG